MWPAALFLALASHAVPLSPCPKIGPLLLVDAERRVLFRCGAHGRVEGRHHVSLGRGGLDKRREGDRKTPLGRYRLGSPRPSVSGFHVFIPVGYPTSTQRRAGFTGGAIGVHGPPEGWPEAMARTSMAVSDLTFGCIMVASADEIHRIARWVRDHGVKAIEIRRSL